MKKCSKCKLELNLVYFHKNKTHKDGYQNWCKSCKNIQWNNARKKIDKDTIKESGILYRYKLSKLEYDNLLANGCEVCGSLDKLCIDHNHSCCPGPVTCGKCIRGILCLNCNHAEGKLKSNPELVLNLYKYLTSK